MWRPDDQALLERLEDEELLARIFRHHVPSSSRALHPRAAGLIAATRALPGGAELAHAGDIPKLVRFIEAPPMTSRPPMFLHHLALYFGEVATSLETTAPDAAANAWMRALAAWLALGEERTYLERLTGAVLGAEAKKNRAADIAMAPAQVALDVLADLGRRAETTSRDLAPAGRAALLALAWVHDAARLAGASEATVTRAQREAERRRNGALDAALGAIGEAFEEANVRGDLSTAGRTILIRAIEVWTWSGNDEAVEQFVVEKLAEIGWELYRARSWNALRHLLDPFRPMIETLAARIESDPSKVAYASACAQMYVFLSDVETVDAKKREFAERAVHVCPTHRNGRLILAAILCDEAERIMRTMVVFARRTDLDRVEALIARAEKLYPQSTDLPDAKAMLERVKKGRISL